LLIVLAGPGSGKTRFFYLSRELSLAVACQPFMLYY
jgi:hypothetical protein